MVAERSIEYVHSKHSTACPQDAMLVTNASSCTHRLAEGGHDVTAQVDVLEHALQLRCELAPALGLQLACTLKDAHDGGTQTQHCS